MNTPRLFMLIAFSFAPTMLAAQGFNCAEAQTPIEKLICLAPEIGVLDKALNAAVRARLAAHPRDRSEILAQSRRWLAERDRTCAVPSHRLPPERFNAAVACLASAYQARLSELSATTPAQSSTVGESKTLCHQFIDSYRSALAVHANHPGEANGPLDQSPFAFLSEIPKSGVTRAPSAAALSETTSKALDQWGRVQTPPIRFSSKVKQDILNLGSTAILTIDQAPETNFYVASQVQGTAHCIYAIAFAVKNGVAERVARALWSDQSGDSCGVDQFFGSIEGRTVAVLDNESPYEPSLAASLTLKPWDKNAFGHACSISFEYDPVFLDRADEPGQEPDRTCENPDCTALKPAARGLVEAVQSDPLATRRDAIARLSSAQRATFERMEKLARDRLGDAPAPQTPASPASYLDQNPLLLPIMRGNDVYLASVGHYTIGWRTYPDWSVKLEKLDHGEMTTIGTASVAMRRGSLRSTGVR